MTRQQITTTLRWLLVPIAATLGIIVAVFPSLWIKDIIHDFLWSRGQHMPGKVFLSYYTIPVCGAFAAFFFVIFGSWAAPKHRSIVALLLLFLGGIIAWHCVGHSYSPVIQIGRPALRIWEPLIGTYLGGVFACLIVFSRSGLRRAFRFFRSLFQVKRRAICV